MKIYAFALSAVILPLLVVESSSQSSSSGATITAANPADDFQVVSRGPHSKTWQRMETVVGPDGERREIVHEYVETATGLCVLNPDTGQYEDADPSFEVTPEGFAIARKTQIRLVLSPLISDPDGFMDLQGPDGVRLRSGPIALNLHNRVTDEDLLVSELSPDAVGYLVAPNEIVFSNAFDGFADVRVLNGKGEIHADLLLNSGFDLAELAAAGFPAGDTSLEMWTEHFSETPEPKVTSRHVSPGIASDELDFGAMKVPGIGKAWLRQDAGSRGGTGNAQAGGALPIPGASNMSGNSPGTELTVSSRWLKIAGRRFVVDGIPLDTAQDLFGQLQTVPLPGDGDSTEQARLRNIRQNPPRLAAVSKKGRAILTANAKQQEQTDEMELAVASPGSNSRPQLVIDPVTLNGSYTDHVFKADTTWYLTGPVYLYGTNVLEGNVVLKSTNGTSATLNVYGTLRCDSGPFKMAVLTAKDDNTVGETISGSTGNPEAGGSYGSGILYLNSTVPLHAHDIRFSYKYYGVVIFYNAGAHVVENCQFYKTSNHSIYKFQGGLDVRNVLIQKAGTYAFYANSSTIRAEHVTAHEIANLSAPANTLSLTNSLLVLVTNWGSTFTGVNNSTNSSSAVFQRVGGGFHYLTNSSPYRNVGTTNITPEMAAILKRTTTYPPIVYSNATISVPTTLGPQAQRDTDLPDLGYHYDPLDYAFGGCDANTNLTFSAGTAVGWFRTTSGWYHAGHGIHIADRQLLQFQGRAESPCYWVRANMVQEQSSGAPWQGGYGPGGITSWANQDGPYANAPTVEARFLICSLNDLNNHFRDDYGILIARFRDCEFYAGGVGGYNSTYDYTNCLFYRVGVSGLNEGRSGNEFVARNCTWYGGNIYLTPSQAATPVSIKDCALDGTSVTASGYAANPSYASYSNNAYTNTSNPFPLGGTGDKSSVTFNWQVGALGRFYLPTNSVLINAGSVAANTAVGLYHFTTQTNQVKETNSTVDIGYHYVAWDIAGNKPIDTDGDGLPDYWEDLNGNGSADSGETDWQSYNSQNGLAGGSALQVFTPLK